MARRDQPGQAWFGFGRPPPPPRVPRGGASDGRSDRGGAPRRSAPIAEEPRRSGRSAYPREIHFRRKTERRATPRSESPSPAGWDPNRKPKTKRNLEISRRFRMIRGALPVGLALFLAHAVRQIFWNSSRLGERSPQPKRIPRNQKPHRERKPIKTCSTNDKYRPSSEYTQTSGRVPPSGLFFSMAFDVHRCTAV